VLSLITLVTTNGLSARLGENREELTERLGKTVATSKHVVAAQGKAITLGPTYIFKKDTWLIQCNMINERCAQINYSKPGDWTQEQIQTLLDNNTQGYRWVESKKSTKMIRKWTRSDKATAEWKFNGTMEMTSPIYEVVKAKAAADAKSQATAKPNL